MPFYIRKASGKKELFDVNKFRASLQKAGASEDLVNKLVWQVQQLPTVRSTKEIYSYALNILQTDSTQVAMRYNIKRALLELGPTGFIFEQLVSEIFRMQGSHVETDQIEQGYCVEHELDIVATKDSVRSMIECKYHNSQKIKTDVVVALYCKARFDDMKKAWEQEAHYEKRFHDVWIVTNTKFTSEAIRYANCTGISLMGWSYPAHTNLPALIDKYRLYPITAIPSLTHTQKRLFLREGFLFCCNAPENIHIMRKYGMSQDKIETLLSDMDDLCKRQNS